MGVIGAGNFARAVLLPRLRRASGLELVGVATATGASAASAGKGFGFRYCTTDAERVLADPDVHAVVIATRHDSHARLAAAALRAGKAVLLEKPLAIDPQGLAEVLAAQAESGELLAVGFNRRFSPLAVRLRDAFAGTGPLAVTYRVNAGAVPATSWLHDPTQGGGRIVGEVCHFVDLVQFLTGEEPREVHAVATAGPAGAGHDTLALTLRMSGGSVAAISYLATGDRSFPKERIEVFGGGAVGVLDDFRELVHSRDGRRSRQRHLSQQKGFNEELAAFVQAARVGGEPPIAIASLAATTRVTFAIEESLRTGLPVALADAAD